MVRQADAWRIDIALTPERSYWRHATDDAINDGEEHAVPHFDSVTQAILQAYAPAPCDAPLPTDMRLQLFVNNRLQSPPPTQGSLQRIMEIVTPLLPVKFGI